MPEVTSKILFTSSSGTQLYPLDPEAIWSSFDPDEGDVTIPFIGKANGFKLPRGRNPGVGYILLRRSDVDNLNFSGTTHSLAFTVGSAVVTLSNLCVMSALAITGTVNSDVNDVYLVELCDLRCIAGMAAINKSYNVPTIDFSNYYASSKNAGSPWTWTTMIQSIWGLLPSVMGSLSLTEATLPAENPENYCFRGMRAWDAFCQVAEDSCNYIVPVRGGTFKLVAMGSADATNRAAINAANAAYQSLNPSWPKFASGLNLPEKFRVFFPRHDYNFQQSSDAYEVAFTEWWRNNPLYSVDVTTSSLTGMSGIVIIAGTVGVIHSPRGAYYDITGTILNSGALSTEATLLSQHAADAAVGDYRRQDIFHGPVTIDPGVAAAAVAWYDYGSGIRTELFTSSENTPPLSGGSGSEDSPTDGVSIAAKDAAGPPDLSRWDLPFERFAVCRLQGVLNPHSSVTAYVEYGSVAEPVITWNNTSLPHQITLYEAFGNTYAADDVVYAAYYSQLGRFIAITTRGGTGSIIRFRLTAPLVVGTSATASVLTHSGGVYLESVASITVYDWWAVAAGISTSGMWSGDVGMEGWASLREGTSDQYDIIWMEQWARFIRVTLTTHLEQGEATALVNHAWGQGVDPGSSITVHDDHYPQNPMFPYAFKGARGYAIRNEYKNVANPEEPYYVLVQCQQMVLYATAFLGEDMCNSGTYQIYGFKGRSFSLFNQDPPTDRPNEVYAPNKAQNPRKHKGRTGKRVWLAWRQNDPNFDFDVKGWEVVDIERVSQQVIEDVKWEQNCLVKYYRLHAIEFCADQEHANIICGVECPTQ